MSNLTAEQLAELTERINTRLGEFDISTMPTLTKGVVRLVSVGMVEEWWNVDEVAEREQPSDWIRPFTADGGKTTAMMSVPIPGHPDMVREVPVELEFATVERAPQPESDLMTKFKTLEVTKPSAPTLPPVALSAEATSALGPEHTVITPFKPQAATRADADDDTLPHLGSQEKAALLREIIGELRMLSENGEMPSMSTWDKRKPAHLPKAQATCFRYNLNWGQLAGYAKLKPSPRSGVAVETNGNGRNEKAVTERIAV